VPRLSRRRLLAGIAGALALPAAARKVRAQAPAAPSEANPGAANPIAPLRLADPEVLALTHGAPIQKGRVKLELPALAENGNSVALRVAVASPMTAADYVKSIHLLSERNPVRRMASFHLRASAGRAELATRVRLAGSQTVVALAESSDGSWWAGSAQVVVTLSACLDE
jgi:sulfur-oxidizing protein SoxY